MAKDGEVSVFITPFEKQIDTSFTVVVRTGDHTLIGQIASLTGGETGNRSPLSIEMLVILPPVLTRAYLSLQWTFRHDGFSYCDRLCNNLLHRRYHYCLQGSSFPDRHLRGFDFGCFCARRSSLCCDIAVSVDRYHSRTAIPLTDL